MPFPRDFIWGTATASYQIEGASLQDGRGECIWHRFSHTPGKVKNGDTGDVACDHYHRYKDDVALMRQLGLQAYRFSISWPRVIPDGTGSRNPAGLDFYDRLVDELLAAGIQPFATLFHWDLPQALQDRGGWANPDSVAWFTDYAALMASRLGDRVPNWITHNEPWVIAILGHWFGTHAPGITDAPTAYTAAHHVLISHGRAVAAIRAQSPNAKVGITLNLEQSNPATDSEADRQAAQRYDGFFNRWFLDPIFNGSYPSDMVALFGRVLDRIDLAAVEAAAAPIDFLGVNYYTCKHVTAGSENALARVGFKVNPNAEHTAMGWEICPDGLTRLMVRIHNDYAPPKIYITENGSAFIDPPPVGGIVEDPQRVDYLERHLAALEAAIAQGVPIAGYFAWSLLDNFEWAEGYSQRFGLIHVDYATQTRTLKRSALVYKDIIAAHLNGRYPID